MPAKFQNQTTEIRWTAGARFPLIAGILFILLNAAQIIFRFTLPSLGWDGLNTDDETQAETFILIQQAVSRPSPIKPGNSVRSIAGIPVSKILDQIMPHIPDHDFKVGGHSPIYSTANRIQEFFDHRIYPLDMNPI
jgi:hypothetical protein